MLCCYLYPPLTRRTHQHKVMALFAWCKELQEPSPSCLGRAQRNYSDRHAALQALLRAPSPAPRSRPRAAPPPADTCNPAHNRCTGTPGITGIALRVPHLGTERVHLTDTYINRKGAEAPDIYQALLLLLGKAYIGCFHHLLYFSLSLGCYKVILLSFKLDVHQCKRMTHGSYPRVKLKRQEGRNQSWCTCKERAVDSSHPRCLVTWLCPPDCAPCPYRSSRISFLIQIQSPRMFCEKLRKASLNHTVNKKHMEVFEAFKCA